MSDSGTDEGTVCGGCGKTYKTMEELQPLNCCNDPPHICASCLESDNEIPCPSCLKKWSKGSDTAAKGHVQPMKEPGTQGEYMDPEEDKKQTLIGTSGDSISLSLNMHTVGEDSVDGSETKSVTNTAKEEETDHELLQQPKTLRSTESDGEGGEDLVPSVIETSELVPRDQDGAKSKKAVSTQEEDTDQRIRTTSTAFEASESHTRGEDSAQTSKQAGSESDSFKPSDVDGENGVNNKYSRKPRQDNIVQDKGNPPIRDPPINDVNSCVVVVPSNEQVAVPLIPDSDDEVEVLLPPEESGPGADDRCITRRCVYIAVGITLVCLAVTAAIVLPYILTGGNESTTTMTTFTTTTAPPPPPQCISATNFTQAWRTNYSTDSSPGGGPHSSGGYACDLWTNDIWFRFTGAAGVKMLDSCKVSSGSCGAKVAFWSDDPTPSDVGVAHIIKAHGSFNICMAASSKMSVIRCSKDDPNDLIYRYLGKIHDPCSSAFCGMN